MTLNLDSRQRAMLEALGIKTWAPLSAQGPTQGPAPLSPARADSAAAPATRSASPVPPSSAPLAPPPGAPAPAAAPAAPAVPTSAPAAPARPLPASPMLQCHGVQPLYPQEPGNPAPPARLGRTWLIVSDGLAPSDPLSGDEGRLLDNMLRAMGLHQHPGVHLAVLAQPLPGLAGPVGEPPRNATAVLDEAVRSLRPDMVLLMGRAAARAALDRTEPLGRLRAEQHTLGGSPALVTYDAGFLLRSPDQKAAAWGDLCRALARVRQAVESPPNADDAR